MVLTHFGLVQAGARTRPPSPSSVPGSVPGRGLRGGHSLVSALEFQPVGSSYTQGCWAHRATLSCGCRAGKGGTDEVAWLGLKGEMSAQAERNWAVATLVTTAIP